MRKFNNILKPSGQAIQPPAEAPAPKPKYSAYRTILLRHDEISSRLADEPVSPIKDQQD